MAQQSSIKLDSSALLQLFAGRFSAGSHFPSFHPSPRQFVTARHISRDRTGSHPCPSANRTGQLPRPPPRRCPKGLQNLLGG